MGDPKIFEQICTDLEGIINDLSVNDQSLIFKVILTCDLVDVAIKTRELPTNQRLHVFLNIMETFEYRECLEELFRHEKDFALRLTKALDFILFDTVQKFTLNHYV